MARHFETKNLISIIPTSFLARSYLNQYPLTNSLRRVNLKATLKGAKVCIHIKVYSQMLHICYDTYWQKIEKQYRKDLNGDLDNTLQTCRDG